MSSLRVLSYEDKPVVESILGKASSVGGTMLQEGAGLDWHFDNGFFLLDKDGHGLFWCRVLDGSTMEVHTTFEPEYRGHYAKRSAREGMRQVFSQLQIDRVLTKCKTGNDKIVLFGQWLGFQSMGYVGETLIMECTLDRAILKDNEMANMAFEADFPLPEDCPDAQASYVGFALLCISQSRVMRGLEVYNRMAILMDWEPLIMVQDNPILLRMGSRQFSPMSFQEEASNG